MQVLGVGMIGFGFIGKVHAHAHRSIPLFYDPVPARTRLVGVCTTTQESGLKAMAAAGFEFETRDYHEILARPDINIIHICTPNALHKAAILDALRAGKHIYCDKPLALNVTEAEEIVALANQTNVVCQMTFNYRFVPALLRARELVETGFLGDLLQFRAAYLHAGYISPNRSHSWRLDFAKSGGGSIMDLGAHLIDVLRFLTGEGSHVGRGGDFTQVNATLETIVKERKDPKTGVLKPVDVDDIAFAQCRLSGGAHGTLETSRMATGTQDELRVELHGRRGAIRFNLMEPDWLDAYDATTPEAAFGGERGYRRIESVTRYPRPYALGATKNTVGWTNFHIASVHDFLSNIAALIQFRIPNPHSPTFRDGLAAQRVIAACQRSSKAGGVWTNVSEK